MVPNAAVSVSVSGRIRRAAVSERMEATSNHSYGLSQHGLPPSHRALRSTPPVFLAARRREARTAVETHGGFSDPPLPQVLEFVDLHGNEVLNLGSFTLLPQHVVRLILARELKADEVTKFQVRSTIL